MSHQAVTWALDASATGPLPAEARLVLIVMANRPHAHRRNVYLTARTIAFKVRSKDAYFFPVASGDSRRSRFGGRSARRLG